MTFLVCLFATQALAQSPGNTNNLPVLPQGMALTSIPNVLRYPPLPAWFDPVTASAADVDKYGLPSRPSSTDVHYARWLAVARAHRVTGMFKAMPMHSHMQGFASGVVGRVNSLNWSGIVAFPSPDPTVWSYPSSAGTITAEWTVPIAAPPSNVPCNGTEYATVIWPGIDGFLRSNGLLQGGSASLYQCNNGTPITEYLAWMELYPATPVVAAYTVNPGDNMVTTVSAYGNGGRVSVTDLTTNTNVSVLMTGAQMIGNSAEMIIERPEQANGTLYQLGNYGSVLVSDISAYTLGGSPITMSGATIVTMFANNGITPISYVVSKSGNPLQVLMQDENCAVSGGC